ncbi:MAG: hypothetical protein J6Y99_12600 [Bacteroidales bacterium]|nr:hypothetical protein [Bacteroidales bacterium]
MKYRLLRILIFAYFLITYAFTFFSAYSEHSETISFFTPNSYELSRYGSTPVDICHGIPVINIPLASISDRNVKVDVSLSYLASGIKVDQEATTVGLGWSLNAGGVITRTRRGEPDEFFLNSFASYVNMNFYNGPDSIPYSDNEIEMETKFKEIQDSLSCYIKREENNINSCTYGEWRWISSPDIFNINFCGRTGSFFLDKTAKGHLNTHQDIDIKYIQSFSMSSHGYFKITDEQGFVYIFDNTENQYYGNSEWIPVSWYLTSITSPSGEQIVFSYINDEEYKHITRQYEKCYIEIEGEVRTPKIESKQKMIVQGYSQYLDSKYTTPSFNNNADYYIQFPKLVSSIESSTGARIDFIYKSKERKDLMDSGKLLSKIKQTNSKGEIVKNYIFSFDYFEPANNQKLIDNGRYPNNFLNYRLKLTGIQEFSANEKECLSPYKFVYYGDDGNYRHQLPYRLSPNQDHWGYYNGQDNSSMFPRESGKFESEPAFYGLLDLSVANYSIYVDSLLDIKNGANRNIDTSYVLAGTLREIHYPTGGYTRFSFEANHDGSPTSVSNMGVGGIRIKEIVDYAFGHIVQRKTYSYSKPKMEGILKYNGPQNLYHKLFLSGVDWWQIYSYYYHLLDPSERLRYSRPEEKPYNNRFSNFIKSYLPPEYCHPRYKNGNNEYIASGVIEIESNPIAKYQIGNDFMYDHVVETIEGVGQTEYEYSYETDDVPQNATSLFKDIYRWQWTSTGYDINTKWGYYNFPFSTKLNLGWKRGKLLSKIVRDVDGIVRILDKYTYKDTILAVQKGFYTHVAEKTGPVLDEPPVFNSYITTCDYLVSGIMRLTSHTHQEFPGVKTVTDYKYDKEYYTIPIEKSITNSDGTTIVTRSYLPKAYGNRFKTLVDKHILSPIDIRQYKSGQLLSGEQHLYTINGLDSIKYKYYYQESKGDIPFSKDVPFTFEKCLEMEYDSNNLLLVLRDVRSKESEAYIWSYSRQYPIARLVNPDAELLSEAKRLNGKLANKSSLTGNDWKELKDIQSKHSSPVSIYDYKPGVGMTQAISPSLVGNKYAYDGFQRIWKTSNIDKNGNILLEKQYIINIQNSK